MATQDPENDRRGGRVRISWRTLTLLAILLLAFFLRFWRLDSLPPGLNHDEAYNGLDALAILDRETFPIYHEGWELYEQQVHEQGPVYQTKLPVFLEGNFGREPLLAYLMAGSVLLFGVTPLALRLVVALAGVLSVLATYGAAYELTQEDDEKGNGSLTAVDIIRSIVPLMAAFVVAVHFPSLVLSRYGVRAMLFVPLEALVVFLFWRGIRKAAQRAGEPGEQASAASILGLAMSAPSWFGAAGFFLGLSLYTYGVARFFPLLFVVFVALWFWRYRPALRRHLGDVALMAGIATIVAAPLLLFLLRHPYYAVYRARFVANRGAGTYPGRPWITWSYNIWRVATGLVWKGDQNLMHNLPGRPFMDPVQALLAMAGLAGSALGGLSWRRVFLILWLLFMLVPSILTGDAPHFARLVGAIPPLALLIAIGAAWLAEVVLTKTEGAGERTSLLAMLTLMVLLLFSALLSVRDYFDKYANDPDLPALFETDDWQLGRYAAALPEGEIIYLSPTQERMATIYYALEGERERLRSYYSPGETLIPAGTAGESAYYLVRPRASAAINLLARRFPDGAIDLSFPSFTAFLLPAEIARFDSGDGDPISWAGAITLQEWSAEKEADRLVVTLVWQADVEMERSYTAYLHFLDSEGELVGQLDRLPDGYPTSDWHPGEVVVDSYTIQLPPDVEPGRYYLQTGFYYLPTQERLGQPVVIGEIEIQ
jgi:4-amino-4-deoxy-L-arabinose transferase-like glycosyltransferase